MTRPGCRRRQWALESASRNMCPRSSLPRGGCRRCPLKVTWPGGSRPLMAVFALMLAVVPALAFLMAARIGRKPLMTLLLENISLTIGDVLLVEELHDYHRGR